MTEHSGEAYAEYGKIDGGGTAYMSRADLTLRHLQVEIEKYGKADKLGRGGGKTCSENAHIQHADKQEVAENIDDSSGYESDHCVDRFAFVA